MRKIIEPINRDITIVDSKFMEMGLDHLTTSNPATFSVNPQLRGGLIGNSVVISTSMSLTSRPQSLLELSLQFPQDSIVQKRLRLERFLGIASIGSQRSALLSKLRNMSETGLVQVRKLDLSSRQSEVEDDLRLFMYLFCAFMDENLPSEQFYGNSPFTSRYYVEGENYSRMTADVALQAVLNPEFHYNIIVGDSIYDLFPGTDNVFTAISCVISYCNLNCNGFLGIGNLATPSIDLLSILA